jgi:hypothetical protein
VPANTPRPVAGRNEYGCKNLIKGSELSAMRVAIMQPYFFPYIGYFQLISAADRFILFDDVQYIRHGWINRNRILKPVAGHQYITVPLAGHSRDTLIKDIKVANAADGKEKILRQLEHYKKAAPYYRTVLALIADGFATHYNSIGEMNGHCLKMVCDYIGIDFKIELSSHMNFDYSQVQEAGEWALHMSVQLQATTYINPAGGMELFNRNRFEENNIQLQFLQPGIKEYNQHRPNFEPGLSIIDVMMFNEPAEIRNLLNDYQLT